MPLRAGKRLLQFRQSDAKMYHMKTATVRDLRYRFREVENLLREGDEIQITKRKRVIAKLVPSQPVPAPPRPHFLARLKKIYRNKPLKMTGAELISRERGRY
jgi:antitoxin (DNA-binding transcriptional repressor) of toxin-antitoxin stability system